MKKLLLFCGLFFWSCQSAPTESEPGTWQVVRESSEDVYYSSLHFADQNNGWAVGDSGTILHTGDSGNTWAYQQSGTTNDLRSVHFVNSKAGWVSGSNNTIIHTVNGGLSWQLHEISSDTAKTFSAIYFADEQTGWLMSSYGELIHTEDGGTSWTVQARSETSGGAKLLSFINGNIGFAFLPRNIFLKTTNRGLNWESLPFELNIWPTDLFFVDENSGWITETRMHWSSMVDSSAIYHTSDGGLTWLCQVLVPELHMTSIYFVDDKVGWAAGMHEIFHTTDGGSTWDCQSDPQEGIIFVDIFFTDASHGWAIGFQGAIYKYVDGGGG